MTSSSLPAGASARLGAPGAYGLGLYPQDLPVLRPPRYDLGRLPGVSPRPTQACYAEAFTPVSNNIFAAKALTNNDAK